MQPLLSGKPAPGLWRGFAVRSSTKPAARFPHPSPIRAGASATARRQVPAAYLPLCEAEATGSVTVARWHRQGYRLALSSPPQPAGSLGI
jgi:hypothetical protein